MAETIRDIYLKDKSILEVIKPSSLREEYCVAFISRKEEFSCSYIINADKISDILGMETSFLKEEALKYNTLSNRRGIFAFSTKEQGDKFINFINEHSNEYIAIAKLEGK